MYVFQLFYLAIMPFYAIIARMVLREQYFGVIEELLDQFPAVGILGPRQVGKTTLAYRFAEQFPGAIYLDLELPSDLAKLTDPELYFKSTEGNLLILDEIHRLPGVFQILRGVIDQRRRKGLDTAQFLLLGSASIELLQQTAESLAGRIAFTELPPFTAAEVNDGEMKTLDRLWMRGGFPGSFLAKTDQRSAAWRQSFIRTYLERDIPSLGPRVPAETLHRFWQMLAHNQGQMLNAARIAAGLGVSGHTVARYLDLLVDLLLVRRLQPWIQNAGKRLTRSPKIYIRDSGLVHALLEIKHLDELLGHPVVGGSWEGFVVETILRALPEGTNAWYYRTSAGAEIDLLLESASGVRMAIEVKRSLVTHPSKGFHYACEDLHVARRYVVYPGQERYPVNAETEAIPFATAATEIFRSPHGAAPVV